MNIENQNTSSKVHSDISGNEALPQRGSGEGAYILGIESSCDDTSAAVIRDGILLSNVTASQAVHEAYGGVVPELASRAHQQNIVPVVDAALKQAGIEREQLTAIAFTRGPGLLGSLLVGVSFAKGLAASLGIPMIDVNHLQGHVLAHFIKTASPAPSKGGGKQHSTTEGKVNGETSGRFSPPSEGAGDAPSFPFLCLLVSGGNSQIILVKSYKEMEIIGQTIDDAAGEAIDKCSKVMGLGYPGGPIIDKLARQGNPDAFTFSKPNIAGYDYSFSGLKTSFLYNLRDWLKEDPDFIEHHKCDLAASLEKTIVDILMKKLRLAAKDLKIKQVAVAGGVSANTGLRNAFHDHARRYGWKIFIPRFSYTTDNAAMIAITGYFKYLDKDFCPMSAPAYSRVAEGHV
ncbi:MAG: tRNA (adenosine(37)-N6)-threonylcarbamoyltransferase complex transferase subunit TsaD [Bacteroidaceae bacterium]|nr:tRNA (adenosine(37)-N6)-threonylcarbamoyltransferase complex transferase subunit TsaD [Bacteroidaceae bacterium]